MPQPVSCDLLLYADDSCLVFSDKNFDNIENQLNKLRPYVTGLWVTSSVFISEKINSGSGSSVLRHLLWVREVPG